MDWINLLTEALFFPQGKIEISRYYYEHYILLNSTSTPSLIQVYDLTFETYYMWHDQMEWIACRQNSILIFHWKSPVHLKCYILISIGHLYSCGDTDHSLKFKKLYNAEICHHLAPLSVCNQNKYFHHQTLSPSSCYICRKKLSQD